MGEIVRDASAHTGRIILTRWIAIGDTAEADRRPAVMGGESIDVPVVYDDESDRRTQFMMRGKRTVQLGQAYTDANHESEQHDEQIPAWHRTNVPARPI